MTKFLVILAMVVMYMLVNPGYATIFAIIMIFLYASYKMTDDPTPHYDWEPDSRRDGATD